MILRAKLIGVVLFGLFLGQQQSVDQPKIGKPPSEMAADLLCSRVRILSRGNRTPVAGVVARVRRVKESFAHTHQTVVLMKPAGIVLKAKTGPDGSVDLSGLKFDKYFLEILLAKGKAGTFFDVFKNAPGAGCVGDLIVTRVGDGLVLEWETNK